MSSLSKTSIQPRFAVAVAVAVAVDDVVINKNQIRCKLHSLRKLSGSFRHKLLSLPFTGVGTNRQRGLPVVLLFLFLLL
jgi:hypothetical protein